MFQNLFIIIDTLTLHGLPSPKSRRTQTLKKDIVLFGFDWRRIRKIHLCRTVLKPQFELSWLQRMKKIQKCVRFTVANVFLT